MTVNSIRRTSAERYTVTVGEEEISSTLGVVTDLRLYEGKNIDGEQLEELKLLSVRSLAREYGIEALSRRLMSSGELRKKLIEKGYSLDTADYCVDWLNERGFLNDLSYAEAVVRHYSAKGYGAGRIRSEFVKRCINKDLWEQALCSLPDNSDTLEQLVAKKLKDPSDREQVRKVSNMLYRRGFSWDEIKKAVSEISQSEEDIYY